MKNVIATTLLLCVSICYGQYNYGLEVEEQDAKIEGKLNLDSGNENVFIGSNVGINNIDGSANCFIGTGAGYANTSGNLNSILGYGAGCENTTGGFNSFFGGFAGHLTRTGDSNSFFGSNSGFANVEGDANCFIGKDAGSNNFAGSWNTFIGTSSGSRNTTGERNSFIGRYAGYYNKTGSFNIAIGHGAGPSANNPNQSDRLYIDQVVGFPVGNDNPLIYGEFNNDLVRINGTLHISETAKLEPQSIAPTCSTADMGTMYVDTGGILYFCNGTAWKTVQLN